MEGMTILIIFLFCLAWIAAKAWDRAQDARRLHERQMREDAAHAARLNEMLIDEIRRSRDRDMSTQFSPDYPPRKLELRTEPPSAHTAGQNMTDGRRGLGNGWFGVGIIIAVGWLVLSYFSFASRANPTRLDVADLLTITSIPVLSVGIGWALRYTLAGPK
jgi:hypothetical protein